MASQKRVSGSNRSQDVEVETVEVTASQAPGLDADVDSMLSEIDEVLEQNAEEFVKSFIQKGGQ